MSPATLPPELLYKIVLSVTIEYLDDLVAGPLSIPHIGLELISPGNDGELKAVRQKLEMLDPASYARNPLHSFLCTSYQLRYITLKVLSHVLGIQIVAEGLVLPRLAASPWRTRIHPTRLAYSNPHLVSLSSMYNLILKAASASPLLHTYQVVGCAESVLTAPQTYGVETMRRSREMLMQVRKEVVALRYQVEEHSGGNGDIEDWISCAAKRVRLCDERSYAISVFTLSLSLLCTNLCSIRRALEMLPTDTRPQEPFMLSMARIYQDHAALMLYDLQGFARFQDTVYMPPHDRRPYLPSYITADDIKSACSVMDSIASLRAHPVYGSRWEECQEAANVLRDDLAVHLSELHRSSQGD